MKCTHPAYLNDLAGKVVMKRHSVYFISYRGREGNDYILRIRQTQVLYTNYKQQKQVTRISLHCCLAHGSLVIFSHFKPVNESIQEPLHISNVLVFL